MSSISKAASFTDHLWHYWDVKFLMTRDVQLPAPGRGAYDRSLTRPQRDAEHRERLFKAAAEVLSGGPLTVARIVERAGVGRSTFYEFFDGPEHLLEQLEQRALRSLESELQTAFTEARTPLERLRAISRRWLGALETQPLDARVALAKHTSRGLLSPAGELLHQTLKRCVDAAQAEGFWFKSTDDISVLAAAAAAEVIGRRHLGTAPIRDAPRVLADVIVKLLR
jgi:AcrR family transcriptional regulator